MSVVERNASTQVIQEAPPQERKRRENYFALAGVVCCVAARGRKFTSFAQDPCAVNLLRCEAYRVQNGPYPIPCAEGLPLCVLHRVHRGVSQLPCGLCSQLDVSV